MQRQVVLGTLTKLKTHPTIEEIYALINKEHPSISKTTVYRNLRQLAGEGIILRVSLPDGLERYDGNPQLHYHFDCRECGRIYDVDTPPLTEINSTVEQMHGFTVSSHEVVFSGSCLDCKNQRV